MKLFGIAIVRSDRLWEQYQLGLRHGRREGRNLVVSMLRRPALAGDLVTVQEILEDLARRPVADLGSENDRRSFVTAMPERGRRASGRPSRQPLRWRCAGTPRSPSRCPGEAGGGSAEAVGAEDGLFDAVTGGVRGVYPQGDDGAVGGAGMRELHDEATVACGHHRSSRRPRGAVVE